MVRIDYYSKGCMVGQKCKNNKEATCKIGLKVGLDSGQVDAHKSIVEDQSSFVSSHIDIMVVLCLSDGRFSKKFK